MSALLQLLTGPEWPQVVKTLLHSLWQGALIAVTLALAMQRVVNPHWRYRFSIAALVAIPVAGIITWAALNAPNPPLPIVASSPVITSAAIPATALSPNPQTKVVLLANHSPAPPAAHWTAWLALLWVVGAVAMLGRTGIKLAGAEQLRRSCRPLENSQVTQLLAEACRALGLARKIRVAVTDKLTSPAVVGVMVPTLILPLSLVTTLAPEQIHFILLHELAHIRRGDYFANLFQLFVEALLFFNPAVWWISHQVRCEREACCDALAIELSGAPADYARTLIHVAENALEQTPAVAPAFGGEREPSSLADRVQRLLVPGYCPSLRLTWRAMIGAFVLGATLLLLSAEGTRVAVTQIARSTQGKEEELVPHQLEGTLSADNSLLDPDHFNNQFNLGEPKDPVGIGPRIPAEFRVFRTHELDGVLQKLRDMRFQLVVCSNKPLGELFRELSEQSEALDKDGVGFRFSVIPIRLRTIPATIDPPLTNASLSEILAAIQGAPQLRLNGVNTNGLVTLQTIASLAQSYPKNKSEFETDQRQPPENASRSIQTNSSELQISGLDGTSQLVFDVVERKTVVTYGGIVRFNDTIIRADSIQVNQKTGDVVASGNVRLEQPGRTNNPSKLELNIYSNSPPARVSTERSNIIYASEKRRAVLSKLKGIQLDRIYFNATPLTSVISELQMQSWRRASDGLGIPIVFRCFGITSANRDALAEIRVTIIPPLTNVTLLDALDAVVKGASRLIIFSIEENAVAVSLKGQEPDPLFMREFKVDPSVFASRLAQGGYSVGTTANVAEAESNASSIRNFFADQGVGLGPTQGKSVFYNDRIGRLVIRATVPELDRIGQLLAGFKPEPQINIKIRFVEVTASELEALIPDLLTNGMPNKLPGWAGILTKPQMNQMLQRTQTRQSVNLLSEGEVTTASGRQAQIQEVEIRTIVTDINPKALVPPGIITTNKDGSGESLFITTNLLFGPTIDIVPAITPDGQNVAMTVIPRMTEFLGYERSTNAVVYENGKKTSTEMTRPRLRTQQMTNSAVVRDGMTLMLAFPPVQEDHHNQRQGTDIPDVGRLFRSQSSQTRTNILFVLVTPTIVDPAAKRSETSAANKDGDEESFVTSTNLRPIIDIPLY